MESLKDAQADMRQGYSNGAMGVIVSGSMWLMSSFVVMFYSSYYGIWALLFGGMMIFPLSNILEKMLGQRTSHTKGNPMGTLAMEGTVWMIMCLPMAYVLSFQHHEWFFQGMMMIIGGRYLTMQTIYGRKHYWILGALLGAVAYLLFTFHQSAYTSVLSGALIEISFGLYMMMALKRK